MRKTCMAEIYKLAQQDERVIFIGSDIGIAGLEEYAKNIPERFFMEGISEQHIVGMMAGLAMSGKIPYLNTIATFITRRCFEQIVLDAALHKLPIRLIGSGGGAVYAPQGPTHITLEDFAILRSIPNMTIIAPADAEEMKRLIPQTLDYPNPIYIRLAKGGDPIISQPEKAFKIGEAIELRKGADVAIISTGITSRLALEAADLLGGDGISTQVLHFHTLKPFDYQRLRESLLTVNVVITIEEHSCIGGLGTIVAEEIALLNLQHPIRFARIGFPDQFFNEHGSQESLMQKYRITTENLYNEAKRLLLIP